MPILNYWKIRNNRKSISCLLIILMLLSMLPTGVMAANTAAEITAYSLPGQVSATIDSVAATVYVTVPFGTDVTALVDTFGLSIGASAMVGTTPQVSGTTPNNFTNPVVYTVTAEAGNTKDWTVTVTVAPAPAPAPAPTPPTVVEQLIVAGQTTVVELAGVVEITVTAGAITGAAPRITAQVMPEAAAAPLMAVATGVGLTAASEVVVLTLTGGQFTAPVQLTLNFDTAKVATGQVPSVFVYNERTGRWIYLGGQVGVGTITVTVDRFSRFGVFATKPLPALADHWGRASIRTLAGMGIVRGYADGNFKPAAAMTRAEFVSMLTRALGLAAKPEAAAARFTDAAGWAQGAIGAAVEAGLVAGMPDGTFAPARRITRAEMAVILARVVERRLVPVPAVAAVDFADVRVIPRPGLRTASERPAERAWCAASRIGRSVLEARLLGRKRQPCCTAW